MARVLRGEIYWADLNPVIGSEQAGKRPVLVISHDIYNKKSGTIIALALTSQPQKAGFPLSFELSHDCLPRKSWVKINQIRTLSKERLMELIGNIDPEQLDGIVEGLNEIVG
jgi:mRNA interferase MazF